MAVTPLNRVYVNITTTGTGTITFGSVVDASFMTPADAGGVSGNKVRYTLEEGSDFEIGQGTLGTGALTMTRDTVEQSKIGGTVGTTKMSLLGLATFRIVASKSDFGLDNLAIHGADVASATTTNLDTATGDLVDVTGTTTITAITLTEGRWRTVRFTGALVLTNGASLVLPGQDNIITAAGDMATFRGYAAGVVRCVCYSPLAARPANVATVSRGHIGGLVLSTAGSSATFSVAAGVAASSDASVLMSLASSISKTTSAWAVGTGNGALDTGAIANSTTYHAYLIERTDTGVVDVLVSLSASAPTMPTNYTKKRRIGALRTNGSAQWVQFTQVGDIFLLATAILDATNVATAADSAGNLITLSVPSGLNIEAMIDVFALWGSGSATILFSSPLVSDQASGSATHLSLVTTSTMVDPTVSLRLMTNTSAQIRERGSGAGSSYWIFTTGWADRRGKDD